MTYAPNAIVRDFITGDSLTQFSYSATNPNEISFSGRDSLTGLFLAGSYAYNPQGVIVAYGFKLFASEFGLPDLFVYTNLSGAADSFYQHAATFDATIQAYPTEFANAWLGGNEQYLANWIDSMAGANQFNPWSTVVDIGGDNNFAFA